MPRLLVYTRTAGYRHDSIPAGVAALSGLDGYAIDATGDPAAFRPGRMSGYAAIVFLSTSGEVLDRAGRDGEPRTAAAPAAAARGERGEHGPIRSIFRSIFPLGDQEWKPPPVRAPNTRTRCRPWSS